VSRRCLEQHQLADEAGQRRQPRCRGRREQHQHARLPVVVATGRDDLFAIDRAFEIGATTFVTKPFNWRLLSHQLRFVLEASALAERLGSCESRLMALGERQRQILDAVAQRAPELLGDISNVLQLQSADRTDLTSAVSAQNASIPRR
jgi:FixJ family two-component response regulator